MFDSLSLLFLVPIFVAGAVAVWLAGIQLSDTTDILSKKFGFGQALGGVVLLAIATNLPELAITVTAAISNQLDLAVGNILGGIGIQTLVLVVLDIFGLGEKAPLTFKIKTLVPMLEGLLVIAVLIVAIMGTQLPKSLVFLRVTPDGLLIISVWLVGVWLVGKARKDLSWQIKTEMEDEGETKDEDDNEQDKKESGTLKTVLIFLAAAIITLIGGVLLEQSGEAIAKQISLTGVLFGSTVLAAATALPEVSTGLASMKLKDFQLAMSDIFGGNAFLPVLFLIATIVAGKPVLPEAKNSDIYLAGLGILLTTVYMVGLGFRRQRQILRMGIDSFVVLVLYLIGMGGLVAIALTSNQ